MQRGRGGMDDFFGFGDPFAGFGGFGRPGSLVSSFFGGRDPFDDPFFTQPFGGMMGPSIFGRSMFGAAGSPFGVPIHSGSAAGSPFGVPIHAGSAAGSPFGVPIHAGFLEDQAPAAAQPNKSRGPVIQEINSDDEAQEQGEEGVEKKDGSKKHARSSKEPYVQDPDEEIEEKRSKHMQHRAEYRRASALQPQNRTYSFHSSTVTYGGPNGAYYTSSTTRRAGGDGVTVEESREADTTTGKATHRVSKGILDKGHSVTRKLGSDGRVDTIQTLHNLNEDEIAGFEVAWKGKARKHLPGWSQGADMHNDGFSGFGDVQTGQSSHGWALPAPPEQGQHAGSMGSGACPPRQNSSGRR